MIENDKSNQITINPLFEREPIYRRNFLFFLADNILFNLAMNIMSPTTLIPDFIRHLTRSEILIGFSSSLFEIGSMLPQLFIARRLLRIEYKKWWVVIPNIPARVTMLGFAIITVILGKDRPEGILLAFLICYGIAAVGNGISNVPVWVLLGMSLDSRWRARMLGMTLASVGIIMLGISPQIGIVLSSALFPFPNNYALLFGAGGMLFVFSIFPIMFVHELPDSKAVETIPAMSEFLSSLWQVLRSDGAFRAMVVTRILTSLFAMASPFYIGFATVQLGLSSTVAVPLLLVMQTIGSVSGALIYIWLGARNNLMYIRLALGITAFLPISALLATVIGPLSLYLGFLAAGLTGSNLLSSYSNWVITHAPPNQRPIYAGLFSTVTAVISLIVPVIGGMIAQQIGYEPLFIVALVVVLSALFVTLRYIPDSSPEPAIKMPAI